MTTPLHRMCIIIAQNRRINLCTETRRVSTYHDVFRSNAHGIGDQKRDIADRNLSAFVDRENDRLDRLRHGNTRERHWYDGKRCISGKDVVGSRVRAHKQRLTTKNRTIAVSRHRAVPDLVTQCLSNTNKTTATHQYTPWQRRITQATLHRRIVASKSSASLDHSSK